MANQRVWLKNTTEFPMVDPYSGARFEPGEATKAELTKWVHEQPTIIRCPDPNDEPTEKDLAKINAQNEADEADRLARAAAAEQRMREADLVSTVQAHPNVQAPAAGEVQE
jgi:hypothetical protein